MDKHDCVQQETLSKFEERLNRLENIITALTERLDNLIKKLDKWSNVTIGLICTIIAGVVVTVIGGVCLAIVIYLLRLGG